MKTTLKVKLLMVALPALVFGAIAIHQHNAAATQTRKAQVEAQLQNYAEQMTGDDAEFRQRQEQEKFRLSVEAKKRNVGTYNGGGSKTWTSTY